MFFESLKKVLGIDVVSNTNTDTDTDTNTNTNSTKKAEVLTKEEAIKLLEKNGYKVSPTTTSEIEEAIKLLESLGVKVEKNEKNEKKKEKKYDSEKEAIIKSLEEATPEEIEIIKDILILMIKMSELGNK